MLAAIDHRHAHPAGCWQQLTDSQAGLVPQPFEGALEVELERVVMHQQGGITQGRGGRPADPGQRLGGNPPRQCMGAPVDLQVDPLAKLDKDGEVTRRGKEDGRGLKKKSQKRGTSPFCD